MASNSGWRGRASGVGYGGHGGRESGGGYSGHGGRVWVLRGRGRGEDFGESGLAELLMNLLIMIYFLSIFFLSQRDSEWLGRE